MFLNVIETLSDRLAKCCYLNKYESPVFVVLVAPGTFKCSCQKNNIPFSVIN